MYKPLILSLSLVFVSSLIARADSPAPAATPSQAALLDVLKSNASLEQKALACHQLAWIGNRDAVPVLAGLLTDEKLSHMARYALEQIPDPSVEEALRTAVPKLKGKLLAGVLSSLGARRDEKSIDMLSKKITDADADIANAAAFALGKIGSPGAAEAIVDAVVRPGAKKPAIYEAALRCANSLLAEGRTHEAIRIRLLLLVTDSPDAPRPCQIAAIRGAKLIGHHSPPYLADLLESDDNGWFNLALELVEEFPGADATAIGVSHLQKLPASREALLIQALGRRGDKGAIPAIRAAASQKGPAVRIAVIRSLALFDDMESLPIILDAIVAPEKEISEAATAAVVKMPGAEVDAALVAMVESPDGNKRRVAIDCLGQRRTASATQALLKIAAGEEPQVRRAAIKALARVAGEADLPQALGVLLKAASPADKTAAENVVIGICISASDKEACAAKVVAAMSQAPAEQKPAMLHVLTAVGGATGLQAVRDAAKTGPKDLQEAAIVALCAWPDQAAAPDLLALTHDETKADYKIHALRGYLRLALDVDLAPERRLEMAAAAQPLIERDEERRLLLRVLSRIQSPKAFAMIEPFLDNPAVKADAAAAAIAVAGKLVQANARESAGAIVAAMEKVKQANPSPELVKKANDIQAWVHPPLIK